MLSLETGKAGGSVDLGQTAKTPIHPGALSITAAAFFRHAQQFFLSLRETARRDGSFLAGSGGLKLSEKFSATCPDVWFRTGLIRAKLFSPA